MDDSLNWFCKKSNDELFLSLWSDHKMANSCGVMVDIKKMSYFINFQYNWFFVKPLLNLYLYGLDYDEEFTRIWFRSNLLKLESFDFIYSTMLSGFRFLPNFKDLFDLSMVEIFFGRFGLLQKYISSINFQENMHTINLNKVWALPVVLFICKNSMFSQLELLVDIWGSEDLRLEEQSSGSVYIYVTYELLSVILNCRMNFRVVVPVENPYIPSITAVYPNANWLEREIWDMLGVVFPGSKDFRRILTDYGFWGHPLKKSFPLTGFVELRYNDSLHRIVFEPLELAQDMRFFELSNPWYMEQFNLNNGKLSDVSELSYNDFFMEDSWATKTLRKIFKFSSLTSLSFDHDCYRTVSFDFYASQSPVNISLTCTIFDFYIWFDPYLVLLDNDQMFRLYSNSLIRGWLAFVEGHWSIEENFEDMFCEIGDEPYLYRWYLRHGFFSWTPVEYKYWQFYRIKSNLYNYIAGSAVCDSFLEESKLNINIETSSDIQEESLLNDLIVSRDIFVVLYD